MDAQRVKDAAEREALKRGDLDTSLSNKSVSASRASTAKDYVSAGVDKGARGTKRSRESIQEQEDFKNKPEIKFVIPDILKVKLVDDWEAVTKNSQVGDPGVERKAGAKRLVHKYCSSRARALMLSTPAYLAC